MTAKNSRIHPQDAGSQVTEVRETNAPLGSGKTSHPDGDKLSKLSIINYLRHPDWNLADLLHRHITILSPSSKPGEGPGESAGVIQKATIEEKNIVLDVQLSQTQEESSPEKLDKKVLVKKITISKTGKISATDQKIIDIRVLPYRFRFLASRVVLKNRHATSFCTRIDQIIQDLVQIRRLIQTYSSTRQLADAYNRSKIFDTYHIKTDGDKERRNRFEHNLKKVTKAVLEEFNKYKYSSQEKIDEIVGLAPMDDEEISIAVFNALVEELENLSPKSLKLPNPHKVRGFAQAIRLLPPQFLGEKYVGNIMRVLSKLSKWLDDPSQKFNKSSRCRDERLAVLDIQRQLLDALVDNRQLQTIDEQNRYLTRKKMALKATSDSSKSDTQLSTSTLLTHLRDALVEEGKSLAEETLENVEAGSQALSPASLSPDLSSLIASSLNSAEETITQTDFSSWWDDFQTQFIGGAGIDKKARDDIKSALENWVDDPDKEIRYLASYNSQALSRIPAKGDSDLSDIMKRGMHLILGAKSLALIVTSQGAAFGEYMQLINHVKAAVKDGRMTREAWYESVRSLQSLIGEAENDPQKHRAYLNSLEEILKQLKSQISWQLVHMAFLSLYEPLVKSGHKENQQYYLTLLARLFQEKKQFTDDPEVRKLAIHILLKAASDPQETMRELAKEQLKALHTKYKDKRSLLPRPTKGAQLMRALPDIHTLAIREAKIVQENLQDNFLLKKAKETAFPVEHKAGQLREKVEEFRSKTEIDKDLSTYVPLKGAQSKDDKDQTRFFLLQKHVDEFIRRDNRRRDYEGHLLNTKGETLKDPAGQPLKTGKHTDTIADPAVLLIHGQAGSGKSLFGRFLEREYWNRYESGGVIPLFISLPALRDPLHQGIEQALSEYGFSPDEIQQMKSESHHQGGEEIETLELKKDQDGQENRLAIETKKESINAPRLLIILDGYDELQSQINLYQAYQLATWKNIKVIITSRTEYLEQIGTYYTHFKPKGGTFEEIFIRPFNQDQIETFVVQVLQQKQAAQGPSSQEETQVSFNLKEYLAYIKEAKLDDLIEHPFMLRIIVDILPILKENKQKEKALGLGEARVKRYDIYELFLTQLFERNGARLRRGALPDGFQAEASLWEYSTAVACFMYTQRRQTIQGNPPSYSRLKATEQQGSHFLSDEPKVVFSKSGSPLKKMGEASFAFIHKSIQEFLVAKAMRDEYLKAFENGQELPENAILNEQPIQEEPSIMRFIMDCMSLKDEQALEKIMRSSQIKPSKEGERPKKSPIAQASANALTLIVAEGSRCYYNEEFRYIQIPGARLDGGYFAYVDFTAADFSHVTARQTVFRGCTWAHLNASHINFGESPKIVVESEVSSISYSPDGKILAMGREDNTISLWDATTGKELGESLRGHEGPVWSVAFSPDGKRLASGSEDNTIRLWDSGTREELGELKGHEGAVRDVAFSPDGKRLVTRSEDNTIRLWDSGTGEAFGELKGHEGAVRDVAFSPDGKRLVTGGDDGTIHLWDTTTGKDLGKPLRGYEGLVNNITFSPDGERLVTEGEDNNIYLWDLSTGEAIGELLRGNTVSSVTFSPDGKRLAAGSEDNTILLWDLSTGEAIGEPMRGHEEDVTSVTFSPDGKSLATGSQDKTIRLWNATTGEAIGKPLRGHEEPVSSISFSPDGKRLASGSDDHTIRLWDATTGKELGEPLRGHKGTVRSLFFSPDGKRLVTRGEDETIRLWDSGARDELRESLRGHERSITGVAFSPDGKNLVTGSEDETIRLWNADTGEAIGEPLRGHEEGVSSVTFSPDGKKLASGSDDHTIRLWDATTGKELGEPLRGHEGTVRSLFFSPDGKRLATGSEDETIRLWDANTGEALGEPLRGNKCPVWSVAFSPNSKNLATGGGDHELFNRRLAALKKGGDRCNIDKLEYRMREKRERGYNIIHLWNADTGEKLGEPLRGHEEAVTSITFSPDGKKLATGSNDATIRLWNADTGEELGEPLRGHEEAVTSITFSPDGKRLATGSNDATVRLWDANTGEAIEEPLRGYETAVTSVTFSPDGKRLATGSGRTIRLWNVTNSKVPKLERVLGKREKVLDLTKISAESITGLSVTNQQLLQQQGATLTVGEFGFSGETEREASNLPLASQDVAMKPLLERLNKMGAHFSKEIEGLKRLLTMDQKV